MPLPLWVTDHNHRGEQKEGRGEWKGSVGVFAADHSSRRLEESDHGTGGHLTCSPVFMLAQPVWSDRNSQRLTYAGQSDSMGSFMASKHWHTSPRDTLRFQVLLRLYSWCMQAIPDGYDFFLLLFAEAKKTCPKLQKLCLDVLDLGEADYSFLSFFLPSTALKCWEKNFEITISIPPHLSTRHLCQRWKRQGVTFPISFRKQSQQSRRQTLKTRTTMSVGAASNSGLNSTCEKWVAPYSSTPRSSAVYSCSTTICLFHSV